jgi:hypothetical protein
VLTPVDLDPAEALQIAREERLDWMNARAALVDAWREVQVRANALRSDLDVVFSGDISTTDNNPVRFRGTTGRLRVGVQFDAPLTRLIERNAYREALIEYQRARRAYLAFEDRISQTLRRTLRALRYQQLEFELRRQAVTTAVEQVRLTAIRLYLPPALVPSPTPTAKPPASPRPGTELQRPEVLRDPTLIRELTFAYSALLNAQNDFLAAWVDYEIERVNLDLDLGTMELDASGNWLDPGPILCGNRRNGGEIVPREPAPLPDGRRWLDHADELPLPPEEIPLPDPLREKPVN